MARERFQSDWNEDSRYRRERDNDEEYARGRDWREWPEDYQGRSQNGDERGRSSGQRRGGGGREERYQEQRGYAQGSGYGRSQSDRGGFGERPYSNEDFGQQRSRSSGGQSGYGYGSYGDPGGFGQGYSGAYGGEFGSGTYGNRSQQGGAAWGQSGFGQGGQQASPGQHPAGSIGFGSSHGANPRSGAQSQSESMRGLGPKNYTRADDRIREDVCDMLCDHPAINASSIEVQVSDGEVTIDGTIPNREQRRLVEDCAENVSGVKHVQNNLRVQQQSSETTKSRSGGISTSEL